MPTVAELKDALKAKGIKGYSGKNKAELEAMLAGGKKEAVPAAEAPRKDVAAIVKAAKPIAPHALPVAVTASATSPVRKFQKKLKKAFNLIEDRIGKLEEATKEGKTSREDLMKMAADNDELIKDFEGLERTVRKIEKHYKEPEAEAKIDEKAYLAAVSYIKPDDFYTKDIYMLRHTLAKNNGVPDYTYKTYKRPQLMEMWKELQAKSRIVISKYIAQHKEKEAKKAAKKTAKAEAEAKAKAKEEKAAAEAEAKAKAKKEKATATATEVTAYNTPWVADKYMPSAWIHAGSKIIIEAIRKATKMVVDDPASLGKYKSIDIPISSLVDVVPGLKGQPIDVTDMGTERMGEYDSPTVSFRDADEGIIGCRLGIHWTMKEPIREDKPGEAWYGTVRLYVEYDPKSMGKKNKWESHVRAHYEQADDEELDDKFEEELKKLVKEDKDSHFTFDVPRGKEALKIAEKIEFKGYS